MIYSEGQKGEDVEEIWIYPAAAVLAQMDGPVCDPCAEEEKHLNCWVNS